MLTAAEVALQGQESTARATRHRTLAHGASGAPYCREAAGIDGRIDPGPGPDRALLLERVLQSRVPHRSLCLLILEAEGPGALTDAALRRMGAVLDIIEGRADAGKRG
jgi:hypothetical protein